MPFNVKSLSFSTISPIKTQLMYSLSLPSFFLFCRREMNLLTKSVEVDERGGMGRSVDYKALTEVLEPHTGARESALRDSTNFPRGFDERWD